MRSVISVLLLLCLAGCASREDSVAVTPAPAQKRASWGEPLPKDCRGETRPVTSGLTAACIAREAIPGGAEPASGGVWNYAVTFRNSRWVVTIHDPDPSVAGSYLIHVDPKTGRVLRVETQK